MIDNHLIENRHIRVFISSTFQDMQDERDYLMKHTFPTLRKLASERDVTLTEIDLRWGITEEESQSGKVVEICLREIENSVPFFIGIIGNRYGWVPREKELGEKVTERYPAVKDYVNRQLSVTEMEMQFGVLDREEDMNAYFYIKDEKEGKEIDNPKMLERLKKAVGDSRYPSSSYSSVEDLAQQVEQAFTALLDKLFPVGNISELEKERIGQRSIMRQLCQNYIRDENNFQVLDDWMQDWNLHQMVVTGASGLGKSALIANWLKEKLSDNNRDYNIIYHFTGNGGSECSHERIKSFLCEEIVDTYGWKETDDKDISKISATSSGISDEKEDKLNQLFIRVAAEADRPLLIVLDAVNQIVDNDNAKLLNWLPVPPRKVKILFSTLEDDRTMQVFKNRSYPIFTLQPLSIEHRKKLIIDYLSKLYGKKLTEQLVERIAGDRQCEITLVLKTLLDELINYGIYETLGDRVEYYLSKDTVEEFYQALLQSYEEEFGKDFVCHALSLIAVSKSGLSEDEILAILNEGCPEDSPRIPQLLWSQFFCAFWSQFTVKGGLVTFSHRYVLSAIEERYVNSDTDWETDCRFDIINYSYHHIDDNSELYFEFLYQLYKIDEQDTTEVLFRELSSLDIAAAIYKREQYLFIKYWMHLKKHNYSLNIYLDRDFETEDIELRQEMASALIKLAIELGEKEVATSLAKKNLNYLIESKKISSKLLIKSYNDTANSLISDSMSEDEFEMAKSLYFDAIDLEQGEKSIETCNTYNGLSILLRYSKEYELAIALSQKSLEISIELFGNYHQEVATQLNSLALCYECVREYEKAIDLYQESIDIMTTLYGDKSSHLAHAFANLADCLYKINQFDLSKKNLLRGIDIFRHIFGDDYYILPQLKELLKKIEEKNIK